MSGVVIPFKAREPDEAHLAGKAVCLKCKHEWMAVAPLGVFELECPECHTMKGVMKQFVSFADRCPTFGCVRCGGILFSAFLNEDVPTLGCAECGELHHAMSLFP